VDAAPTLRSPKQKPDKSKGAPPVQREPEGVLPGTTRELTRLQQIFTFFCREPSVSRGDSRHRVSLPGRQIVIRVIGRTSIRTTEN